MKLYQTPGGNEHLGGVITSWHTTPDRTCIMNWNMDRAYFEQVDSKKVTDAEAYAAKHGAKLVKVPGWSDQLDYGTRASRSMAVDCSGASGAPLLVALVERVTVPSDDDKQAVKQAVTSSGAPARDAEVASRDSQAALRALFSKETGIKIRTRESTADDDADGPPDATTRWSLPLPTDRVAPMVRIHGNRFILGYSTGPTVTGVLVAPSQLRKDSVMCDGKDAYFCVFTLQEEGVPDIEVQGEGLAAVVRVGKRTVRFSEGSLVLL